MRKLNREKLNRILDARVSDALERCRYAGVQLIVKQEGETIARISRGFADAPEGKPLADNSMFRLASMTKPVTGFAALIAIKNGWFRPEDPVSRHLPEYADMQVAVMKNGVPAADHPAKTELKMFHLLSHCSGIMAEVPIGNALFEQTPQEAFHDISSIVRYCSAQPLAFDPLEATGYSAYAAFDAVAKIIEDRSGMSYADFCRRYIFDPIGADDLTFCPTEEQWSRMVSMHDRTDNKTLLTVNMGRHLFEGFPLTYTCAGAGLAGTLDSYSRFAELLLCRGTFRGNTVVPSDLFSEMTLPRVPDGTPGRTPTDSWGFGVRVVVKPSVLPVGSFGWSGAYGTHFWVDPENRITAVFLKNNYHYDAHGCGSTGVQFEKDVMSALE